MSVWEIHTKGSRDCQGHRNGIISESVFADRGGLRLWAKNVGRYHNSIKRRLPGTTGFFGTRELPENCCSFSPTLDIVPLLRQ